MEPEDRQRLERVPSSRLLPLVVLGGLALAVATIVARPWAEPGPPVPPAAALPSPAASQSQASAPPTPERATPQPTVTSSPPVVALPVNPAVLEMELF